MKTIRHRFVPGIVLLLSITGVFAQSSLLSRRDYVVGDHPVGVIAVDYDGDGYLDLISVNQQTGGNGDIGLIKGFSNGTMRKVGTVTAGALPSSLLYMDANNDTKPDLIAANLRSQEVSVNLGNGLGGFGAKL